MGFAEKLTEKGENCEHCAQRYRRNAYICNGIALIIVRFAFDVVGDELSYGHLHDKVHEQHKVCDDEKQFVHLEVTA